MNDNRSFVRSIRGPVTLITVGALFALNNFTRYSFHQTWPVILIVFGLLSLWRRTTEPEMPYVPPPPPPPPAYAPPQGPYDPVTGAYRGPQATAYNAPPTAGRGGFGTSAPPRPESTPEAAPPAAGGTV